MALVVLETIAVVDILLRAEADIVSQRLIRCLFVLFKLRRESMLSSRVQAAACNAKRMRKNNNTDAFKRKRPDFIT